MAAVTVPTAGTCDVIIAGNGVGVLGYQENGDNTPVHSYARVNSDLAVVHVIAGRQAPVAFRPAIEGNSDVFTLTLEVAMDTPGVPVAEADMDRAAFDPLIEMIENTRSPYLSVISGHGRRWYAFVEFIAGSYTWDTGHEHQGQIKVTEIATTPIPITVED